MTFRIILKSLESNSMNLGEAKCITNPKLKTNSLINGQMDYYFSTYFYKKGNIKSIVHLPIGFLQRRTKKIEVLDYTKDLKQREVKNENNTMENHLN
jgi:hypothetical protein